MARIEGPYLEAAAAMKESIVIHNRTLRDLLAPRNVHYSGLSKEVPGKHHGACGYEGGGEELFAGHLRELVDRTRLDLRIYFLVQSSRNRFPTYG